MRTVEQIVDQVRAAAGADFAFVLTRKGRLVTHRAPRDMPEEGRDRLARAARPLVGTDRIIEVTLPREELVPFGGAAPVDVYIGVVAEQAIVCVVMASWADKMHVTAALEAGMRAIAPLLRRGLPSARRVAAGAEPAKGSPYVRDRASVAPPPDSGPISTPPSGPVSAPVIELRPSLIPEVPKLPSLPEISIGEAPLGRASMIAIRSDAARGSSAEISIGEAPLGRASLAAIGRESGPEISIGEAPLGRASLAAIGRESGPEISIGEASLGRASLAEIRRDAAAGGSAPEITIGEAPLGRESLVAIRRDGAAGGSLPDITIGEAPLGRESLIAIERASDAPEHTGKPRPSSSPEAIRIELASLPDADVSGGDRVTLPWVEAPEDAKRAADAARVGRKLAVPKVTIRLEDAEPRRPAKR